MEFAVLFNTFTFWVFFAIVYLLYMVLPFKWKKYMLLAASYIFYMAWNVKYIFLIVLSTVIDYIAARVMQKEQVQWKRRLFLILSLCTNLGLLFSFKYYNFFNASLTSLFESTGIDYAMPHLNVLLPVGISFYTFQTLSYSIDVYRRKLTAEKDFVKFALYVSFFPQLVAGPIERASNLLPQFNSERKIKLENVLFGLKIVLIGLFKKMVIADNLAPFVNMVYGDPGKFTPFVYILATYAFAFQIYADFSGYSDIAIGVARMMGFNFMENFNRPYFSKTITEFWRRWHISLSSWLRDYLYIPLGGNRKGVLYAYRNLFITMILGGLWHGASWNFVFWGFLNGLYLTMSKLTLPYRDKLIEKLNIPRFVVNLFRMFMTFHFVCITWVYFRAQTITEANMMLVKIGRSLLDGSLFQSLEIPAKLSALHPAQSAVYVLVLLVIDFWLRRKKAFVRLKKMPVYFRYPVYAALLLMILILGNFTETEFVYFQF